MHFNTAFMRCFLRLIAVIAIPQDRPYKDPAGRFCSGEFFGIDAVGQESNNGHRPPHSIGNGYSSNGNGRHHQSKGHSRASNGNGSGERWNCTGGQRGFILRLVNEHNLDKQEADDLAYQFFGIGVRELDKMQASQFLDELLAKVGQPRQTRYRRQTTSDPHSFPVRGSLCFHPELKLRSSTGRTSTHGIIVALMGWAYFKTGRYSFIADGIRNFIQKNPRLFGKARKC